jgi:membrane protease YdiL (CAAX protease family)
MSRTNYSTITNIFPLRDLIVVFSLVLLGSWAGQWLGLVLLSPNEHNLMALPKSTLLALQAVTASSAFIVAPWCYLRFFAKKKLRTLFQWCQPYALPTLTTLSLVFAFMMVNAWFVQWNMTVKLPNWLHQFEVWAKEKEAHLQALTSLLTTFHSMTELGIGILVIGVIPAIGEELLFRGVVQPLCYQRTHNIHLAIGVSAFIFSAIHMQFYGFVPRLLLGGLFGYLYWWTKDLFFPIVAHFFNNATALIARFLDQHDIMGHDTTTAQTPSTLGYIFFSVVTVTLAYALQKQGNRARKSK